MSLKVLVLSILTLAICTDSNGQDSLNMRMMAQTDTLAEEYNDIWGYSFGGKEYAVIGGNTSINIVDVSECGSPTLAHQEVDGDDVIWRDFKDYGDYVYAICDGGGCTKGLQSINKTTFAVWSSTAQFTTAHNIFIDKATAKLYVAGANNNNKGLWVYDLSENTGTPTLLAEIDFQDILSTTDNYYVHDVYVENDTAYCSHGYIKNNAVWDMTDLDNVSMIGDFQNAVGYNHSSWVHPNGSYEYLAREAWPQGLRLQVLDISDLTDITEVDTFSHTIHTPTGSVGRSTAHNPFVHLDRLFISNYQDGVKVYDLDDPEHPELLAYYDTYDQDNGNYNGYEGCWGVYPFLPSGCIVASDITYGLYTLRLLEEPTRDASFSTAKVILEQPGAGVVFSSNDNSLWKYEVLSSGNLVKSLIIEEAPNSVELKNTNFKNMTSGEGVVLRSSAGDYYELSIGNTGIPAVTSITTLPTDGIRIASGDLYLSQHSAGMKLKSPDGTCYLLRIANGGLTDATTIDCD